MNRVDRIIVLVGAILTVSLVLTISVFVFRAIAEVPTIEYMSDEFQAVESEICPG